MRSVVTDFLTLDGVMEGPRRSMGATCQESSRKVARKVSALDCVSERSVSACVRVQIGAAAASSARPAAVRINRRPRLSALVHLHLDQATALQRLEISGQRRAIHCQQRRDILHVRRLRTIERHQERELALRQANRAQCIVKAPRQRARRALDVQAQAMVAHMQRQGERHFAAVRGTGGGRLRFRSGGCLCREI